jgi:rubrerythrin
MTSKYALTIDNEKLWKFYNAHPNLDFEKTNLLFMDVLEKFLQDANSSLTTSITSQLIDQIKNLQTQINVMTENHTRMQNETALQFNHKLSEFKKDYMEEVKVILTNNVSEKVAPLLKEQNSMMLDKTHILINSLIPKTHDDITSVKQISDTMKTLQSSFIEFKRDYIDDVKMILTNNVSEKVAPLLKEQNAIMLDKTHILINELIPKNQNDIVVKNINESLKSLYSSISDDTNKLLSSSITQKTFDDFISSIDNKFSNVMQSSQSLFCSTEQRLDTSIRDIKKSTEAQLNYLRELSSSNQNITSSLNNSVSELLKKMENSSSKGKISENIVFNILHSLFPCSQIDFVGTTKETGDIILTRSNKPKILIENKNWDKNVVQEEVKKFIHDVEKNDCCGIFLSQNFGIANKENFQIDVSGKNVLLYLHEVHNDAEKIRVAISIVDHFKSKLDELDNNTEIDTISREVLDTINREYQNHALQKINMVKLIKECNQKMLKQVEEIQIPSLEDYLSTRYAFSTSKFTCEFCGYIAKNQSAISAHQRGCNVKKNMSSSKIPTDISVSVPNK